MMNSIARLSKKSIVHNGARIHKRIINSWRGLHTPVIPAATYSPWNRDEVFLDTYDIVKSHTLVDKYRCYELWTLVRQSAKLEGALIEVGVWRGGTGAIIAKAAELSGIENPVYLCDTFAGVVKAGTRDSLYQGGEHADASRRSVEALVHDRLQLDNVRILEGIFPGQTSHLIEEEAFRFCHIDVDVYDSAKGILEWIWNRMVSGGIVVYDDYGSYLCDGIRKHVEEHQLDTDRLLIHNLNGHAIFVKIR